MGEARDNNVRIVFMGTPEFAVPTLEMLARRDGYAVVAVYTAPDTPARRGGRPAPSPIRIIAEELGMVVRTPSSLREPEEVAALQQIACDLIVVAAYGQILPQEVLAIPRYGCINLHASLLPRWRGAAPIQRAILAGDEQSGVSIMRMEEGLDTGDWCAQASLTIEDESTYDDIQMALARMGALLLDEKLDALVADTVVWHPQNERGVTYAHKIGKAEMMLAPGMTARELHRRIRASNESAPARVRVQGKEARIIAARYLAGGSVSTEGPLPSAEITGLEPGQVRFINEKVIVAGSDPQEGVVVIDEVKPAGGRAMPAHTWAHGMRFSGDTAWQ